MKDSGLFRTDQVAHYFSDSHMNVAVLNRLHDPCAGRVQSFKKKMIMFKLFAEREQLRPRAQFFRWQAAFSVDIVFCNRILSQDTTPVPSTNHLLAPNFVCRLCNRDYSPRYAFNRSSSSASFTGFVR